MINSKKVMGTAMAIAAAGMLSAAAPSFAEGSSSSNVHCYGVNKCKGHND